MNGEDIEEELCEHCGLCCKIFGDNVIPTAENLFCWIEQGRQDVLKFFFACKNDGTWMNCADLEPEELGDLVTVEMRDPINHDYLCGCPFLRRLGRKRYICGIHDIKPEMCCTYQPWIWGETYFNRCLALKKREKKIRFPM
jgi:Fe-S-cluster containining protein